MTSLSRQHAPAPCGAVPSPAQLAWNRLEFYGFIHFTTNTFTGKEWGYGDESPSIFNPSALDARQWARVAREVGMKGLILTCKHHDGFCLWPSKHTEHSVKSAPWKQGKGNVVRDLCDACAAEGLRFGVYLSPWDRNHPAYGTSDYIAYFQAQLRELLTEYGDIFEVWFDGANGGDGYYGGSRETRSIDRATYYCWPEVHRIVRELQPNAIMFSDAGPGCRWIGNEAGHSPETCWATVNNAGRYPGYSCPGFGRMLGEGEEGGDTWLPAETDVSIRPGWFYHEAEDGMVKTAAKLLEIYCNSVGHGTTLLLNLPPDRRGLIHETDVARLRLFRTVLDALFEKPLLAGACATASNSRLGHADFAPARVTDGDPDTYWATDDATGAAWIELAYPSPVTCNLAVMQEPVFLGQRIRKWHLDADVNGTWQTVATGTTIGYKRIARFAEVTTARLRLHLDDARACPALSAFVPYRAPAMSDTPRIDRDRAGMVHVTADPGVTMRYTTDGRAPGADAPLVGEPFALPRGGVVRVAILPGDNPGFLALGAADAAERRFGLAKERWRILAADSTEMEHPNLQPENAIDENATTIWHTAWNPTSPDHPHWIAIDLGDTVTMTALGYLPRQDGIQNAVVDSYAWHVSMDGKAWGAPVAEGRFDNILANPCEQVATLTRPVTGRYVKFASRSAANGSANASAAEINVYVDTAEPSA